MASLADYLARVWRDVTLNRIAASTLVPDTQRWRLLRWFGVAAEPSLLSAGSFFGRDVHIGYGTFVNYQCFFDDTGRVTLGRNVNIAMQVSFLGGTHEPGTSQRRAGTLTGRPIDVGDGAWIGARAVIMPGASIGAGAVVAAGSVVRGEVPADTLWAGNPAVQVRAL